jgi:hypothetical protein
MEKFTVMHEILLSRMKPKNHWTTIVDRLFRARREQQMGTCRHTSQDHGGSIVLLILVGSACAPTRVCIIFRLNGLTIVHSIIHQRMVSPVGNREFLIFTTKWRLAKTTHNIQTQTATTTKKTTKRSQINRDLVEQACQGSGDQQRKYSRRSNSSVNGTGAQEQ